MSNPAGKAPDIPILYVDDEKENLTLFDLQFRSDFKVLTASSAEAAVTILAREQVGVLLSDERMPGMTGIDLLTQAAARWPDVVRVIVSAYSDGERLLRAINLGHAHEYILKPWDADELRGCIERGLAIASRRRVLATRVALAEVLQEDLHSHLRSGLIGASSSLRQMVTTAQRAAETDATVLIVGETGTGKELVAKLIHDQSTRADGPFIRFNCAALPESLIETELFGHEQGAFTGATRPRKGRFELASGGTLFLDEIGDISPHVQIALLRVLQEREIERVGGNGPIAVDTRIVAATHQDLPALVRAGTFRRDLFYRLNVIPIQVPALKERREDIPLLINHFIAKHDRSAIRRTLSPEAIEALTAYSWPGNVRELESMVLRALVLSREPVLTVEDFCLSLDVAPLAQSGVREEARQSEYAQLRAVLLEHGGNLSRAARALGIPRSTLFDRAQKLGL